MSIHLAQPFGLRFYPTSSRRMPHRASRGNDASRCSSDTPPVPLAASRIDVGGDNDPVAKARVLHVTTTAGGERVEFPSSASDRATVRGELLVVQTELAAASPSPGLILIPDVRGISPLYLGLAGRLSREGFTTLVIDIYSREGVPELPDMAAVDRVIAGLPDERVLGDVEGARRFLAERSDVRADRIGILGFCLGGQYALMSACRVDGLAACASFYGMLRYKAYPAHKPASPLDLAPKLACPLLGLYGAEDPLIPLADVAELRAILAREGKAFELITYDGAGHAFLNDARPDAYRPEAAVDAWSRATAFFHARLRNPS
jgi:carboxymethylenebutenolidase